MGNAANVPQHLPHNDMGVSRMDGKNIDRAIEARNDLLFAQRGHMLALHVAIAAGVPMLELEHSLGEFHHATGRLLRMFGNQDGAAPMVLG